MKSTKHDIYYHQITQANSKTNEITHRAFMTMSEVDYAINDGRNSLFGNLGGHLAKEDHKTTVTIDADSMGRLLARNLTSSVKFEKKFGA